MLAALRGRMLEQPDSAFHPTGPFQCLDKWDQSVKYIGRSIGALLEDK